MINDADFLEELLLEAEAKEDEQTSVRIDLLLLQIREMQNRIEDNFKTAEKEIEIINEWALRKNTALQEKISFIEKKLELFMREQTEKGIKTVDLPNGVLRIRKLPDKAEVVDLEKFMLSDNGDLITLVPETAKPNINAIKAFIKRTGGRAPEGCRVVEGKEEFSYKIKKEVEDAGEKESGTGTEQAA